MNLTRRWMFISTRSCDRESPSSLAHTINVHNLTQLLIGAAWLKTSFELQSLSSFKLIDLTKGNKPRGFWSSLLIWKRGHDCSSKDVFYQTAQICSCQSVHIYPSLPTIVQSSVEMKHNFHCLNWNINIVFKYVSRVTADENHHTCLASYHVYNKHCSKILQETLLNRVSNDLLPFMVGQSHDNFTLLSVEDEVLFQYCQQVIQVLCTAHRQEALWSKPECQVTCLLCPRVSDELKRLKY
jgi:hypothetical protein